MQYANITGYIAEICWIDAHEYFEKRNAEAALTVPEISMALERAKVIAHPPRAFVVVFILFWYQI